MSFKTCPNCGCCWPDRERFLSDPALRLIGYQPNFATLKAGLFLFNHACGTTLAVPAEAFAALYHGPIFQTRLDGREGCAGHCQHEGDLAPCPAACECAYVRAILDRVARWPKAAPRQT